MVVFVELADQAASGMADHGPVDVADPAGLEPGVDAESERMAELVRAQRPLRSDLVAVVFARGRKMTAREANSPSENPVTSLQAEKRVNQSLFGNTPMSRS